MHTNELKKVRYGGDGPNYWSGYYCGVVHVMVAILLSVEAQSKSRHCR